MRRLFAWAPAVVLVACGYSDYAEMFAPSYGTAQGSGGAGGSAGTGAYVQAGGAAGVTGGSGPGVGGSTSSGGLDLIDDMEEDADGGSGVPRVNGRSGGWYTYNDGTRSGWQNPATPFTMTGIYPMPREGSRWAARTFGAGFTSWGAGLGLSLTSSGTYDASAYTGIVFYAMVGDQAPTTDVRIVFPEPRTIPTTDPSGVGKCTSPCWDHFGQDLKPTKSWQRITVVFADARQVQPVVTPAVLDTAHLTGIDWQAPPNKPFDLWVDDIAFMR
jgi:hypothetical protein